MNSEKKEVSERFLELDIHKEFICAGATGNLCTSGQEIAGGVEAVWSRLNGLNHDIHLFRIRFGKNERMINPTKEHTDMGGRGKSKTAVIEPSRSVREEAEKISGDISRNTGPEV
jgi:hypothetical protein